MLGAYAYRLGPKFAVRLVCELVITFTKHVSGAKTEPGELKIWKPGAKR